MKKILPLVFGLILLTLSACGVPATPTQLQRDAATETFVSPSETPTAIPPPTDTAAPSATETSSPVVATVSAGVSFANDIAPIFNKSCNKCHGVEQVKEGLDMTSYDSLIAGSFNGSVITPGNSVDSLLVEQLLNSEMPKRGTKLTTEQIQTISDWINAGALNN